MRYRMKKMWAWVLSLGMMFLLFMCNGVEAEAAVMENVVVSDIQKYESGCLKSFVLSYEVNGFFAAADAQIAVQESSFAESDLTNLGNYAYTYNYNDWPQTPEGCGFIAWNEGGTFQRAGYGESGTITITFADGDVDLNVRKDYYFYVWTKYMELVYPDELIHAITFGTGDVTEPPIEPVPPVEPEPPVEPNQPIEPNQPGDAGNNIDAEESPSIQQSSSGTVSNTKKEEEENISLSLPVLKSINYASDELETWQEVIAAIATIEPKKLSDSQPNDTKSILKVDISSTAGFVGHEVLQTLAKREDASLHTFTGNGVAITFAGVDVKDDARAVRVTNVVSDKLENGKRVHIVDFFEKGKLETAVAFHVNLPQGADSLVDVYTEGKDGVQNHIKTMKADAAGNVAFMIDSTEKFIFEY